MFQAIKNKLLVLAAILTMGAPALVPATAYGADIQGSLCQGASLDVQNQGGDANTNCKPANAEDTLQVKLNRAVNWISIIVGVIAVIMIIFAGFRYITSGGSQDKIKGAKDTLLYAIIGLVIVALAQIITKFVINTTTNS